ncbi:GDSL-like Lipase/Acylhydrolase family protein [Arachidicoccus rhizosphaerae]|uniref:GDSL-like Lipase/Acylhydrolase family protein n=1 Tax=Arachidicoccus rhizosphaerae TaxID=551991 RepID=A0A1H3WKI3_9BACT|nr:SGNH/GDSL hydrolase family protein [Arachidicoccus rhizosphaerae]SDZ86708.1 GDSL-like Lipase/Acylhydrolase family protein [Arachidicoccus rhizosphaerae]
MFLLIKEKIGSNKFINILSIVLSIFLMAAINQVKGESNKIPSITSNQEISESPLKFFKASDSAIRYIGRIDFSKPDLPRFWNPGVYLSLYFEGSTCKIILEDQMQYGVQHNYIEIVLDGQARRIRLEQKTDTITVADGVSKGKHHLIICKDTESNIGYISVAGVLCSELLPQPEKNGKKHLIECFGDSITCGASSDLSDVPCGKGRWEDQHNCYMSYGPRLARMLDADWIISAVSGIGLMHSCCNLNIIMPQVYDKLALSQDSIDWDFDKYQPDVATICLGQNDGIQDLDTFCTRYVDFVCKLRKHYPKTTLVLLTSPMADTQLTAFLQKALVKVQSSIRAMGDQNIYYYFFKNRYSQGCDSHPTIQEHEKIAAELLPYIQKIKHWNS